MPYTRTGRARQKFLLKFLYRGGAKELTEI